MGTNLFGFEAHDRLVGSRYLHATVVPTDGGFLSTIEVEGESEIVYRRELRFATRALAEADLTLQLHFMNELSLEDLQRCAQVVEDHFAWTDHRDFSAKMKKKESDQEGEFDTHEPVSIGDVKPKLHYLSELILTTVFVKRAGSTENFLQSIGATPDVIQFVSSQPPDVAKRLVNEVRKNNQITTDQLQAMAQQLASKQKYEPTRTELYYANEFTHIPGMSDWILLQFKRHRGKRIDRPQQMANFPPYEFQYTFPELGAPTPAEFGGGAAWLIRDLNQIADWVEATHPQLASYDLAGAKAASDKWHEEEAAKGAGQGYEENNVVFTLKNGWTIQLVRTANDLEVEGNLMGHCVGSYCDRVQSGRSYIYSLRDPKNLPHVTIETSSPVENAGQVSVENPDPRIKDQLAHRVDIEQIQGKSDQVPIPEYQAMIKEWFESVGTKNLSMGEHQDLSDVIYNAVGVDSYTDAIDTWRSGMSNEYGISSAMEMKDLKARDLMDAYSLVEKNFTKSYGSRNNQYIPRLMRSTAEALADLAWDSDIAKAMAAQPNDIIPNNDPDIAQTNFAMFGIERQMDAHFEEFNRWDADYSDHPYPERDEYNSDEEFAAAEEEFSQNEQDARDESYATWLPGGMDLAISKRWQERMKETNGLWPSDVIKNAREGKEPYAPRDRPPPVSLEEAK